MPGVAARTHTQPVFALARFTGQSPPLARRRLERVKGIEPSSSAWKAVALPLSYTRPYSTSFSTRLVSTHCAVFRPNLAAPNGLAIQRPGGRRMVEGVGFEPT